MAAPRNQRNNENAKRHGIRQFEDRGPARLTDPAQIERFAELKRMVKSEPGRIELRQELAARAALLVDLGFSELIRTNEAGKSIWNTPTIKRMGTYMAELRRLLDSFPADDELTASADKIIEMMHNDS